MAPVISSLYCFNSGNRAEYSVSFFIIPFSLAVVFYINYFYLIDKFLFKKQTYKYLFWNLLLIIIVSMGIRYWKDLNFINFPPPPEMGKMGLFNIDGIGCGTAVQSPSAAYMKLCEKSVGKDTTTGHFEIAGIVTKTPFPTFPKGFPPEVIAEFEKRTGRGTLCNKPYSGTQVIKDFGREHLETGKLIVYTSADSVFQIAAHERLVPPEKLYEYCRIAREILVGKYAVGRVIARPFVGEYPDFERTPNRHDFSLFLPKKPCSTELKRRAKALLRWER